MQCGKRGGKTPFYPFAVYGPDIGKDCASRALASGGVPVNPPLEPAALRKTNSGFRGGQILVIGINHFKNIELVDAGRCAQCDRIALARLEQRTGDR
jgi:hypothetical protein